MKQQIITSSSRRLAGFTLVELLIVMAIISILLLAVIPAVNSLTKSSGRKAAISNLTGAIEQARAHAIKSGAATYIAFPTFASSSVAATRYNHKSYALFEDDAANPANPKQITPWRTLPTGVSLRGKTDSGGNKFGGITSLPSGPAFPFQPMNISAPFPCIKFNPNGEIESPASDVLLVVFEGYVDNGIEVITGSKDAFNPPNPIAAEALNVSHLTGRAEPTVTPTPSS